MDDIVHRMFRSRKSLATFAVVCLIIAMVVAACGGDTTPTTTAPQIKTGGNMKIGLNTDVVTLNPVKSSAFVDRQVMLNFYDTLVRVNQQNDIVPWLATSWSYTSPTQLVFTLRTDVKFHDGTPFNADAVVFNINRILSTPSSPRFSEISTVQSVQAIDASHVQITLKKAFSPLLATLTDRAGMILSPTAVQKLGTGLDNAPKDAGSGPFMFVEWIKGDHLTAKRNPNYWMKDSQGRTLPYLDTLSYRPINDGNVRFTNLETGTINVADGISPNDVPNAKSNSALIYKQSPGLSFFGMQLNTKSAPLDNVHVRKAVAWAVNRDEILKNVLQGIGVVSQGPIPPSSWAYDKNYAPYSNNVQNAKAELTQAGITNPTFTLLIPSGDPLTVQEAQYIQSELQTAGITMNIKQQTFATILSDTQAHNFQAALIGWSGRPDPDGNMYSWFHTGGGNNNMQYSNAQVDNLLDQARISSDRAERTKDYQDAQKIIVDEASYVFINHGVTVQATTNNVKNFTLLPTGIIEFAKISLG